MKNSYLRRISAFLSLVLALCILSPMLVSCAESNKKADETTVNTDNTTVPADAVTENDLDEQGFIKDKLPESVNLETTLTMLHWSDFENVEFYASENDTGLVEQAIYRRNQKVDERLGIKIEYEGTPGNSSHYREFVAKIDAVFNSGNVYDIYAGYTLGMAATAQDGFCSNLLDYDALDFSAPWWPQKLVDELTINNKLFFATGDLSTNLLYMMYVMYFNKDIMTNLNLENPYDCVADNTWTYEKMMEMAKATQGMQDSNDPTYGFTANTMHTDPFFYGAGLRTVDKNADGLPIISEKFNSETTQDVVTLVCDFFAEPICNIGSKCNDLMKNGRAMFLMSRARTASRDYADATFSYGIAPIPKYKSEQESYSTCLGMPCSYYAISEAAPHRNEASMVLECLSSEGYRTITPVLFEVTMKIRFTTDPAAAKTFDMAREGVSFDLGRTYSAMLGNLTYSIFRNCITKNNPNFTQTFKVNSKALNAYLEDMVKAFK